MRTVLAGALSGAVWVVAATHGYAFETIWLPAVVVAVAWHAVRKPVRVDPDAKEAGKGAMRTLASSQPSERS